MVSIRIKKTFSVWIFICTLVGCAAQQANFSWDLKPASSDNYGYVAENPIRIGQSKDLQKNVELCRIYLSSLRTIDQQPLLIITRASVEDPINDPQQPKGFLGVPLRSGVSKGGILDRYELVPVNGSDTFSLFFDIYHKDTLQIPKGLVFVSPAK